MQSMSWVLALPEVGPAVRAALLRYEDAAKALTAAQTAERDALAHLTSLVQRDWSPSEVEVAKGAA